MSNNKALEAFVPAELLTWMGADADAPTATRRVEAVVLFCDVSSFTTMANRMVHEGRSGLGALREGLNSTFSTWITTIYAHGGVVAKFIGDAIVAVWRVSEAGDYASAIRSAQLAAEAIIRSGAHGESLAGMEVHGKCGVGVGWLDVMTITISEHQRELIVNGDALVRATEACTSGEPGTVELSDGRSPTLPAPVEVQPSSADLPARFVSAPIRERIEAGHSEWLGELRLVSMIFVGLPAANDAQSIQAGVRVVADSIESPERQLTKINVDDKGVVVMIVYGAPTSHDDDPLRAVSAALAASRALTEAGVEHSVGVSSGRAFCGAIGSHLRRDYNITGHVANLANRLMALRDGVVVDAATVDLAGKRFELADVREIALKGIDEPVAAGHPTVVAADITDAESDLVGRSAERAVVEGLLAGDSTLVAVEGEAGIGKSTVARYAMSRAQDAGLVVAHGVASVTGEGQPYGVWQRAVASAFSPEAISAAVAELAEADSWFADRRPLASVVTLDDTVETSLTAQMSGIVRGENTRAVVIRLIRHLIAGYDALFVLEDAQWFDSASWSLLEEFTGEAAGERFFLNYRPMESTPRELTTVLGRSGATALELGEMSEADIEELMKERFQVDFVAPDIVTRMRDSGAGNPLFAEQLALALLEAGSIEVHNGSLVTPGEDLIESPLMTDTLETILTSRIDQAPADAQLTLKVASVIGREFPLPTLEAVHPVATAEAVDHDTEVLVDRRLVRYLGMTPAESYEFWHRLTRDVAYELLPDSERIDLHERIARWFETHQRTVGASVLAHHYLAAQQWHTAAIHIDRAAFEARENHSNLEAARHFRMLGELAADGRAPSRPADVAKWLRYEGDALLGLGRYAEARVRYKEALAIWGNHYPESSFGFLAGTTKAIRTLIRRPAVLEDAAAREASSESAQILNLLSQMAYFDQKLVEMGYCSTNSIKYAEQGGDHLSLARAHGTWSIVSGLSFLPGQSLRSDQRALEEARKTDNLEVIAYANLLHGVLHYARPNWDEAVEGFELAMQHYRTIGAESDWEFTNMAYAYLELFRGDMDAFAERLRHTTTAASNQVQLWTASGWVMWEIITGTDVSDRWVSAVERTLHAPRVEKGDAVLGWGVLAQAAAATGNDAKLAAALQQVKETLVGIPAATAYSGFGLFGAVTAAVRMAMRPSGDWDRRRAMRLARRSTWNLRVGGLQNPVIRPLAHLALSLVARTDWGRNRHLKRAREVADRLGTHYLEPLLRHGLNLAEGNESPSTQEAA